MRVVVQRVLNASVCVKEELVASINEGLVVLVGITNQDTQEDINWLSHKICHLRIFNDDSGLMNRSLIQTNRELIIVSQFTLQASTKKGHRPSYIKAAKPNVALPLYHRFISSVESILQKKVQTGIFGANMQVQLVNDGPVTLIIDSKHKE